MPSLLQHVRRVALDVLYPPQCALCQRAGAMLCDLCAALLTPAEGSRCNRCWMPIHRGDTCAHCDALPPSFTSLRSAFVMEDGARALVHRLKYDGMTALAKPMAALMSPDADCRACDTVVPVPLHRGRERSRGYNQAAELARYLAASLALPLDVRAARRTRATTPLVKAMSREERRAIVAGAFSADSSRVEGMRILLIDDVVTTGATLDSCATALLTAGASEVRCLTFARAD